MKHILLILGALWLAPALQADSMVFFSPSTTTVAVGDTFEAGLSLGDIPQLIVFGPGYSLSDLYAFQVEVDFDPTVLQVIGVNEGTLLPNYAAATGATTLWLPGFIDNTGGSVSFILDTLAGASNGADTSNGGLLFSVDFQAIGTSSGTTVSISNVCMQCAHDGSVQTCALSDDVIGTASLASATINVAVSPAPEPSVWSYFAIGSVVLLFGSIRRNRRVVFK